MASKLQIEEVLQQINDEQWCDLDDCLDDDQDENDDFSRLEDPLDKAGAGNQEDVEGDEIPDNTMSPLSPESVSILPCSTPPDLPARSTILHPIHMPTASTVDQVPTNSSSQHLFIPVPEPKVTLEDDSQPYDYFCQIWGCDTFKFIAEPTNLYATQKGRSPWENVSEDEMKAFFGIHDAMVLFKGKSAMRQYMPTKTVKWGYKCWCACDATNGFMYNVDVYQGAGSTLDEAGLGSTVVYI